MSVSYDFRYFSTWQKRLQDDLTKQGVIAIPAHKAELDQANGHASECYLTVVDLEKRIGQLQKQLQKCKKHKTNDTANDEEKVKAWQAEKQDLTEQRQTAKTVLDEAVANSVTIGTTILQELEDESNPSLLGTNTSNKDYWTLVALSCGGAKPLAAWCAKQGDKAERLISLLQHDIQVPLSTNESLLYHFLLGGGPRNGNYGTALEIYTTIQQEYFATDLAIGDDKLSARIQDNVLQSIYYRLALACALELCQEMAVKVVELHLDTCQQLVDFALARYQHYRQAYQEGELDPAFDQFCVWELRQVVNSDAPNDQLSWARQSLRNYRPDHVLSKDPLWRYTGIVKSDVGYNNPDWYLPKKSYDQILAGGGKCGPRAWYGRYICKAFGIPTWGCKQPAHAAMVRWTTVGWKTALGGGIHVSGWEGKSGTYFLMEMQVLNALGEAGFMERVLQLQWLSKIYIEKLPQWKRIPSTMTPDPSCFWESLALIQLKRLSSEVGGDDMEWKLLYPRPSVGWTLWEQVQERQVTATAKISKDDATGMITIPATDCIIRNKQAKHMKQRSFFEGGHQLFLKDEKRVFYLLDPELFGPRQYHLTIMICTVHRSEKPLTLQIGPSLASVKEKAPTGTPTTDIRISVPYTKGMWRETEPVVVTIPDDEAVKAAKKAAKKNDEDGIMMGVNRQPDQKYGFAVKWIRLIPIS